MVSYDVFVNEISGEEEVLILIVVEDGLVRQLLHFINEADSES